ncbi:hypothetical protein NM688_g883 [Phlebia brevispora]|uniref:Uncharacterized protein n=1 Tax=Phlebia brevispora TaxID=194682 RepID=A0ACC1TCW1_9APHY|nr:hypothetical protein NM688_g883 [Phlebia brevispora]
MATAAAATRPPSATRRSSPADSSSGHGPSPSISRGATARSAVSHRVTASSHSAAARRASLKPGPPPVINGETKESLAAALKQETEHKEKLLVQVQDKDQTISTLKTETHNLSTALHGAETRLAEMYADQNRMEEEMAARMEVMEKLRIQVKELEKEKRDTLRRYNEQTATFEAERQAFYDNEQHLKSRIQSLTQARRQPPPVPPSPSTVSIASAVDQENEHETEDNTLDSTSQVKQDVTDPEEEPAEMTALRLELSTLSTSHSSLQATLALLQSQLNDLKRVNHELQEENESYNILLREKTLSGQFDIMRMGAAGVGDTSDHSGDDEDAQDSGSLGSRHSARSRSTLDPVDETVEPEEQAADAEHRELDPAFEQVDDHAQDAQPSEPTSRNPRSRHGRKRSSVAVPHGESLANLPITGPGLDLAAELGRAENKDMLDGQPPLEDRTITNPKSRKSKKTSGPDTPRKASATAEHGVEPSESLNDLEYLRNEVKSLKDANKALSLYASKIIDRIISQEGFEHVLAADYERVPPRTPATPATTFDNLKSPNLSANSNKARPQSAIFSRSTPGSTTTSPNLPHVERLTTFESLSVNANRAPPTARASRRSLSFDWKGFSMFGGGDKKSEPAGTLRPLTLRPTSSIPGARKLDTYEDEEDRKERERLNATMKLMGIEKPAPSPTSPLPPMLKSFSSPAQGSEGLNNRMPSPSLTAPVTVSSPTPTARFSFFRRSLSLASRSETSSTGSSLQGSPRPPASTPHLTEEALEQAEVVNNLAALDAHERVLSAEMAKGAGGGFTEIVRRSAGDKRSSRRSGSGSTVWSAGMSKHEDGDD